MKGNNRDVLIAGLYNPGSDPPDMEVRRVSVDQNGAVNVNVLLAGSSIFSLNPFSPQFDVDVGVLDMVPVVNFGYLAGPPTGTDDTTIFGRQKYAYNASVADPTASMMVAELAGEVSHDAPAADTAATVTVNSGADEAIRITGFGVSITAVNAIAAAIQATLIFDPGGANTVVWSQRFVVPAGQTKEVWIPGPLAVFQGPGAEDLQLSIAAPGAGNFVTATIAWVGTGAAPS